MIVRIFALTLSLLFSLVAFGQSAPAKDEREAAQRQLAQRGIRFDVDSFILKIAEGDAATVKQFLVAGMSPSAKDEASIPLLAYAIWKGRDEIALTLIDRGADVNAAAGEQEKTMLIMAASCGRAQIVEGLLAKGANLEAKDKGGHTAFLSALFGYGFRSTSEKFSSFVEMFAPEYKETARECADKGDGHQRTIKLMLDKKADVNVRATDGGETPLSVATIFANTDVVRTLLAHGVDVNAVTWRNRTALQWALVMDSDLMRKDPELRKNKVMLEWLDATAKNRAEIVKLLKQAGAK